MDREHAPVISSPASRKESLTMIHSIYRSTENRDRAHAFSLVATIASHESNRYKISRANLVLSYRSIRDEKKKK